MRINIHIHLNSGKEIVLEDNVNEKDIDNVRKDILEIFNSNQIIEMESFNIVNNYVTVRPSDVSLILVKEETRNKLEEIKDVER